MTDNPQMDLFPYQGPIIPEWLVPYSTHDGRAFDLPLEAWVEFETWRHTDAGREVANLVIRYALDMRRRGFKHFGMDAIINRIRWQQKLQHGPDYDGYKINSRWKKRLSLWAMTRSKDLEGFFRIRNKQEER